MSAAGRSDLVSLKVAEAVEVICSSCTLSQLVVELKQAGWHAQALGIEVLSLKHGGKRWQTGFRVRWLLVSDRDPH